ncbi:hypothetical protein Q3A86_18920 [Streptomyces sp. NBUA17]|uniref:hypothetical protein n=1 Tax=Streptomyces sp. NBUA17 TaxID=3062275 RepID=UPI0037DA41F0
MDIYRRHRPVHGGAGHVRPEEPLVLEEWDDFVHQVVGIAPHLAAAREWVNELQVGDAPAA